MQEAYIITSAGYVEVCDGSLAAATGATRIPMSEAGGVLAWLFCRNHATAAAGHPRTSSRSSLFALRPASASADSGQPAWMLRRCRIYCAQPTPILAPDKIKYRQRFQRPLQKSFPRTRPAQLCNRRGHVVHKHTQPNVVDQESAAREYCASF
jgi:hypothetical protein